MLYLNQSHINKLGIRWSEVIDEIFNALKVIHDDDFVQPIKPYLRFNEITNRIIAMPAYVGGNVNTAGLKWIASFPRNIDHGISRAHSITILNNATTGEPFCLINSNAVSCIRTCGVSGLVIREYKRWTGLGRSFLSAGIVGFGPIGRLHLEMLESELGDSLQKIYLYDIKGIDLKEVDNSSSSKIVVCNSWEQVYRNADIFITCTVSSARYINLPPKKGSLQLNVSLRDYMPICKSHMDIIIVDSWNEVCRENTDIEVMHRQMGLRKEDTIELARAVFTNELVERVDQETNIMFNPMGMASFDIAIASYYFQKAFNNNVGIAL